MDNHRGVLFHVRLWKRVQEPEKGFGSNKRQQGDDTAAVLEISRRCTVDAQVASVVLVAILCESPRVPCAKTNAVSSVGTQLLLTVLCAINARSWEHRAWKIREQRVTGEMSESSPSDRVVRWTKWRHGGVVCVAIMRGRLDANAVWNNGQSSRYIIPYVTDKLSRDWQPVTPVGTSAGMRRRIREQEETTEVGFTSQQSVSLLSIYYTWPWNGTPGIFTMCDRVRPVSPSRHVSQDTETAQVKYFKKINSALKAHTSHLVYSHTSYGREITWSNL